MPECKPSGYLRCCMASSQTQASARLSSLEPSVSGLLSCTRTPHQLPKPVKDAKADAETSGHHLELRDFLHLLLIPSTEHWLSSSRSPFPFSCLGGKQQHNFCRRARRESGELRERETYLVFKLTSLGFFVEDRKNDNLIYNSPFLP